MKFYVLHTYSGTLPLATSSDFLVLLPMTAFRMDRSLCRSRFAAAVACCAAAASLGAVMANGDACVCVRCSVLIECTPHTLLLHICGVALGVHCLHARSTLAIGRVQNHIINSVGITILSTRICTLKRVRQEESCCRRATFDALLLSRHTSKLQ